MVLKHLRTLFVGLVILLLMACLIMCVIALINFAMQVPWAVGWILLGSLFAYILGFLYCRGYD